MAEENKDVLDALGTMKEDEMTNPSSASPDMETSTTVDLEMSQEPTPQQISVQKQLQVFEEINIQMGKFCQALKVVDAKFDQQAQVFFKAADELASKEKLNDSENVELAVNLAAWAAVKIVGKLYANLKTSQQLGEVKRILRQEADGRLDTIKNLRKLMPAILDASFDRYSSETDLNQSLVCLSNLRESEYMNSVSLFLEATYEAAQKGQFQDYYAYPSFAPINRHILYGLLCGKPELAQNEYLEGRRECIYSLIIQTDNQIKLNGAPSKETFIFASDPQVMAIAIHDINPMTDNDEVEFTDDNQQRLKSQEYYEKFTQLYMDAMSNQGNAEAKAILGNETLAETVNHYLEIDKAIADSQSRLGTQIFVIILVTLLGFLSIWLIQDWKWYWGLLLGLVAGGVTFMMMPLSKVFEDRDDKLNRIVKSVQDGSRSQGGEVKMIDLASMDKTTTRPWKGAIIGGILGFFLPPYFIFGTLAWGVVGLILVLIFGGDKDQENSDYSYSHIKVGPSWTLRILMYLLIAGCIYTVGYHFLNKKNKGHAVTTENVENTVVTDSAVDYSNEIAMHHEAMATEEIQENTFTSNPTFTSFKLGDGSMSIPSLLSYRGDQDGSMFSDSSHQIRLYLDYGPHQTIQEFRNWMDSELGSGTTLLSKSNSYVQSGFTDNDEIYYCKAFMDNSTSPSVLYTAVLLYPTSRRDEVDGIIAKMFNKFPNIK